MTHNTKLDSIKAKINALLSKTVDRGCTEAEASAAISMVNKLLIQHNLSLDELDVINGEFIQVNVGFGTLKYAQHLLYCSVIAEMCGVKCWVEKNDIEASVVYMGMASDVQLAEYLMKTISAAMFNETEKFKHTLLYINTSLPRKSLSTSFQNEFGRRIYYRIKQLIAEQRIAESQNLSDSRALVVVAKSKRIEQQFEKTGLKLHKITSGTRTRSKSAAAAGAAAADRVNLHRPLAG